MRKLLYVLLALVLLLIGALALAPFLIPTDTIKTRIAQEVERATGRAFSIEGPVSVSLLPTVAVSAEQVRLANAPEGIEANMAELGALEAELAILPLLTGSVEIARFVLVEPVIHLEVAADGLPNWQFQPAGGATQEPAPAAGGGSQSDSPDQGGSGSGLPITDLRLGEVRLVDGTLTYTDAANGQSERIEAIDVLLELENIQSPFAAEGSLRYKGRDVALDLGLTSPLATLQGGASAFEAALESDDVLALSFDGEVHAGDTPSGGGALDLRITSIRELAAWLAEPLEMPGDALQTLAITGQVQADPTRVAFDQAEIALDEIEATGAFEAILGGSVPKLVGRLDVGHLNVNPYLPQPVERGDGAASGEAEEAPSGGGGGTTSAEGGSGSAQVPDGEGAAQSAGWSREPLALPPIGGANVRFALSVESIQAHEIEIGRSALDLELEGNTLALDLTEFALYDGEGQGTLRLTGSGNGLELQNHFVLEGLQARPFLTDAMDFDLIAGTARADLTFETSGQSEYDLVSNLDGQGEVMFNDGAIIGYNLAQLVRSVATAGFARNEDRKTDFAELGGSFTIEDGLLSNDDLRLQAPLLRLRGSGTVDLPPRTIDYRIEPVAAPTLKGQGGSEQVEGILVPVDIKGSWDNPRIIPDVASALESVVRNQEQLGEAARQVQEKLDDPKAAEQLLENLGRSLGGSREGGSGESGQSGDTEAAKQLLKGLFGN